MPSKTPQVYRKMHSSDYYPGQYSISNAKFLHLTAHVDLLLNLELGEPEMTVRVSYYNDGDMINLLFFDNIEEAMTYLKGRAEKAVNDNIDAFASGEDRQIEDT